MPKRSPTAVNTARNAMPRMISGIMMGSSASVSSAPCPRNFLRDMPTAPRVPMTMEMPQLHAARIRLDFSAASRPLVSLNSAR